VASTASCSHRGSARKKRGPKGPDEALIRAIVELKSRNPRFGCPRIVRIVSQTFGIAIDKNVVHRLLYTGAAADLNQVRWVSYCRDLVQLPVAA